MWRKHIHLLWTKTQKICCCFFHTRFVLSNQIRIIDLYTVWSHFEHHKLNVTSNLYLNLNVESAEIIIYRSLQMHSKRIDVAKCNRLVFTDFWIVEMMEITLNRWNSIQKESYRNNFISKQKILWQSSYERIIKTDDLITFSYSKCLILRRKMWSLIKI